MGAFLHGCPLSVENLVQAGILECRSCILIQGAIPSGSDSLTHGVIEASLIHHIIHGNRSEKDRPVTLYEFRNDHAVNLMPNVFQPPSPLQIQLQPRYMDGSVFTPDCLGSIVG